MNSAFLLLTMVIFFLCGNPTAKADPSADSWAAKTSAEKDPVNSGLQSGRYQSRSTNANEAPAEAQSSVITIDRPKKKRTSKQPASISESSTRIVAVPAVDTNSDDATEVAEKILPPPPDLGQQWSDLLHGGAQQLGPAYRARLHPDDNRQNRLELEVASGLVNDSATGNETYRVYSSTSPFASLKGQFWLTPLIGFSAGYQSTLGESINTATSGSSGVLVKSEWERLSIDFRKYFGLSRRANSLQWGFLLSEYKFTVPSTESTRIGLRSDALGMYLQARFPTSPHYAWIMGAELFPYDNGSEQQTALNLSSGTSGSSYKVGVHVGGEIKFDRQSQILWTIGSDLEKTNYTGSASIADPANGQTPNGVSVLNTWTYLHLGYAWGQ